MKKSTAFLIVFFITIFISSLMGSATQSEARGSAPVVSAEPSRVFDGTYNAVWLAVIRTISQVGFAILNSDKASGSISTDYFLYSQPSQLFPRPGYRYRVNALVGQISDHRTQVIITTIWEMGWYQSQSNQVSWQPTSRRDAQIETKIFNAIQSSLSPAAKSAGPK